MNTVTKKNRLVFASLTFLFLIVSANTFAQQADAVTDTPLAPVTRGATTCPIEAPVVLNQPPNQVTGVFADADCASCGAGQQSVADDFILAAATDIGQLVIHGGYFPGDLFPIPSDPWTITFRDDVGGLPGAVISTQDVVPTEFVTGVVLFGVSEIEYSFSLSTVSLPAGTFWVEIFTNSVGNADSAFWEAGDLDLVNGIDGTAFAFETPGVTWTNTAAQNFALTLCGPGVSLPPPPAVPTLSQTGLTIMVIMLLLGAMVTIRRYN